MTSAKRPGSIPARARRQLAFAAGRAAAFASRVTGRGGGASIRGAVMTRIDPSLFCTLLAGKRIGVVSGTNGKTTTTHLLTAALRASVTDPREVVTAVAAGPLCGRAL